MARGTIDEIDRIVRALREDEGLRSRRRRPTARRWRSSSSGTGPAACRVTAACPGAPPGVAPSAVAWAAYRILQEALTNAARHGRGSAERVAMSYGPGVVEITVRNPTDPTGPTGARQRAAAVPAGGLGILGMRERAALLGGTLDIAAAGDPGAGPGMFRLHARLPHAAGRQVGQWGVGQWGAGQRGVGQWDGVTANRCGSSSSTMTT